MQFKVSILFAAALMAGGQGAKAAPVWNSLPDFVATNNLYNSNTGPQGGNGFLAQRFDLNANTTIRSVSFVNGYFDEISHPTSVDWKIYGGSTSPIGPISSGTANIVKTEYIGPISGIYGIGTYFRHYFDISPAILSATNTNFLALHTYSDVWEGWASSFTDLPSFYSGDGGRSFGGIMPNYGRGFAFALDDASVPLSPPTAPIPEPAVWGLMIAGFGLAGMALRHRRATTTSPGDRPSAKAGEIITL